MIYPLVVSICACLIMTAVAFFPRELFRAGAFTDARKFTALASAPNAGGQDDHSGALPTDQSNHHDKPPEEKASAAPVAAAETKGSGVSLLHANKQVKPTAVLAVDEDLYFLTPDSLWVASDGVKNIYHQEKIELTALKPPPAIQSVRVQEFFKMASLPEHNAIVVLDKSGDLYEYLLRSKTWHLLRANLPFLKNQPDPEFIDLCRLGPNIALLDPERNQIWKVPGPVRVLPGLFPDILPWRVKEGDAVLGDGVGIAFDGSLYALRRSGVITIYGDGHGASAPQTPFKYVRPANMRPSRLVTAAGAPLYVVSRENNCVYAIDKKTRKVQLYTFASGSDLRGMFAAYDGFWILNKGLLSHRLSTQPDAAGTRPHIRRIDSRLDAMVLPIVGMRLPRHPGVFPGARRLYRYGVHEGMDLFYDSGAKTKVQVGTPIVAAENGKVIRSDHKFVDMDAGRFARVMAQCYREHRTSAHNEDLFRGCQVWIDHGHNLITRYAHLDRVNTAVKQDDLVKAGETIGYVGVSGTGQNLPGRTKFPHLHFEIWLDGHYLGWGLTPVETMQTFEDIFGHG